MTAGKVEMAPTTLNPARLDGFFDRDSEGEAKPDSVLSGLQAAMRKAHESTQAILALKASLAEDKTLLPAQRDLRLKEKALKAGEAAAKHLDAARAKMVEEINRVSASTMPPRPSDQILAGEIRSVARAMSDRDRGRIFDAAIAAGDVLTVGALLSAPGYLSGMSDIQVQSLSRMWRQAHHLEDYGRIDRLSGALEAIDLAASGLVSFVRKTTTTSSAIETAKAKQADAVAALDAAAA